MSRHLAAALYLAAAGSSCTLAATLAALPFHGTAQGLVFVEVSLATASMAGALTPRRARFTTREDRRP
jgi:hypothetical protein